MQRLEVSGAVRLIYRSLGVKGLTLKLQTLTQTPSSCEASRNGKFFGARFFQYLVKTAFPRILQKMMIYRQLSHGDSVKGKQMCWGIPS